MLNLISMLSMRVEPPSEDIGRVHRISDNKPAPIKHKAQTTYSRRTDDQKAAIERNKQNLRIAILVKIESGVRVRAHLASSIGICRKTATDRCDEMVKDKLLRSQKIKGDKHYFVTASGIEAIKQAWRNFSG